MKEKDEEGRGEREGAGNRTGELDKWRIRGSRIRRRIREERERQKR